MPGSWSHIDKNTRTKLTRAVFVRDGYQCQIQYPGTWKTTRGDTKWCSGKAEHVHHINGGIGGWVDIRNMQASCAACNQRMGNPIDKGLDPVPILNTRW